MAPLDRGAQRPLPRRQVPPAAGQQAEPVIQAGEQLLGRQDRGTGRCQLDRQGQAVKPAADRVDRLVRFGDGSSLGEQCDGLILGQWPDRMLTFAVDPQQLPARDKDCLLYTSPSPRDS